MYADQFAWALPKLRLVALASIVFALAVFIDVGRSELLHNERIRSVDYHSGIRFTASTGNTTIRGRASVDLVVGDLLDVYQTPWLGKVRKVHVKSGTSQGAEFTVNEFLVVQMLSLLVLSMAGAVLSGRYRPDHAFTVGFVNCVGLFFLGICLLAI